MSSMNFFNVEKEIKNIKKELHFSFDVADRTLKKGSVTIGFIYLKSFTDNLIFSTAIYQPISDLNEEISFSSVKNIVQANDVKEIKKEEIVDKIVKGAVIILINNSDKI